MLPYRITDVEGFEIAYAASGPLAFAMFRAALNEHPHRGLILCKDGQMVIERSA